MLNLMGFATWIPVVAFLNIHVAELTVVNGASMYPFLNEDKDSSLTRDLLLTYKWSPQENIQRGMVVTLRYVFAGAFLGIVKVCMCKVVLPRLLLFVQIFY
jgi:inner membrane protease subunit 2